MRRLLTEISSIERIKPQLEIGMTVYHQDLYWGREPMKIVQITHDSVLLEGDWSGGTHGVCQQGFITIEGLFFKGMKC